MTTTTMKKKEEKKKKTNTFITIIIIIIIIIITVDIFCNILFLSSWDTTPTKTKIKYRVDRIQTSLIAKSVGPDFYNKHFEHRYILTSSTTKSEWADYAAVQA